METVEIMDRMENRSPTREIALSGQAGQLLSPNRISEIVEMAAQNTVDGMISQDMDDFNGACLHFSLAMRPLFPEFENERILKACEAFTAALFAQSKIKDRKMAKEDTLHDERWEYVKAELITMCDLLNIPKAYATETTDWFRYHAIRDDTYVKHLLEAHRVLSKRVIGNDAWYRELGGLYLSAVALHDKHDPRAILRGREIMRTYFGIIFSAKASVYADPKELSTPAV